MKRRLFLVASALAATTGLVVACGDDDSAGPSVTAIDAGRDTGDLGVDSSRPLDGGSGLSDGSAVPDADAGTLAAPTFSLPPGVFGEPQCLSISAPAGTVHYTTDGSTPTEASATVSSPIVLDQSTITIRALALDGAARSAIAEATYQYLPLFVPSGVSFAPPAGAYDASVSVQLGTMDAQAVCYTVDGAIPDCVLSYTCGDSGLLAAPPTCSASSITYDGGRIELGGDSGASAKIIARRCLHHVAEDPYQSIYAF